MASCPRQNMKNIFSIILCSSLLLAGCTGTIHHDNHPENGETGSTRTNAESADSLRFLSVDSIFIHQNFKYKGKVHQQLKWTDKTGTHIVFTSETGLYYTYPEQDENQFHQNAEIWCYHYLQNGPSYALKWSVYDYSKDCPVDAMAAFCPRSLEVTDLDRNGTPEIWTAYQTDCRGDVGPRVMKVIMYEGPKKYKLEGNSLARLNDHETFGGEIKVVVNFNENRVFMEYARKKWARHLKDKF